MRSWLEPGWKVLGIPVRVHWTMLFLLAFLSWGAGAPGLLVGAVSLVLLFGSVLAHELAHALAARRYGIGTAEILLMPIGGVAKITSQPRTGREEVVIALAGPAMSLTLAGVAWLGALATAGFPFAAAALGALASANLMLGLFNLVPAFPMDGGRVLRGALRERAGLVRATRIAAKIARVVVIPMALLGVVWGNFSLLLLAGFVWFAARSEERAVAAGVIAGEVPTRVDPSRWTVPANLGSATRTETIRVGPYTVVRVVRG